MPKPQAIAARSMPSMQPVVAGEACGQQLEEKGQTGSRPAQADEAGRPKKYANQAIPDVGFSGFTPATDGQFIYAWFGDGVSACFTLGGPAAMDSRRSACGRRARIFIFSAVDRRKVRRLHARSDRLRLRRRQTGLADADRGRRRPESRQFHSRFAGCRQNRPDRSHPARQRHDRPSG